MVFAVDIGNTNIVFGCFEGDQILFTERISTAPLSTVLEYTILIKTVLDLHGMTENSFSGCIICSVVPPVTQTVREAAAQMTGTVPLVVGAGIKTGLRIQLDDPAAVGSDRIADAVAASTLYACPVITVDMGTATTISVVDENKTFLGGMIIPGVRVALESLSSHASQLPEISLNLPKKVIGKNTVDCMRNGIIYHNASGIDGIVERIESELGKPCTVVATGGNAKVIIPSCKRKIILDETLLLKGMMMIYQKNQT